MRRVAAIALLTASLGLAACGSGGSTGAASTSSATKPTTPSTQARAAIDVKLRAPARPPRAGQDWPVTITARTAAGAPVDGTVSYAFVFGGQVVARRPGGHMAGGTYHDELQFPARAEGIPITLRVVVRSHGRTGTTERTVKVRR